MVTELRKYFVIQCNNWNFANILRKLFLKERGQGDQKKVIT